MPLPLVQSSLLPPSFPLRPRRAPFLLASPSAIAPGTLVPRPVPLLLDRRRIAALPNADEELLRAITAPSGPDARLPAIRSYDADIASLTLIGAVGSEQAVTAAAADGGAAAEEHLSSGVSTMVLETVFPGGADERSTVSTRLNHLLAFPVGYYLWHLHNAESSDDVVSFTYVQSCCNYLQSSPLKMLFVTLAGACIFVVISVLAQVCWPHIKVKTSTERNNLISSREIDGFHFQSHGTAEVC
ncbi:hypothetical protein BHE74_00022048 [Ensete ventricosum]|nr:hypothetical protein BHE74_00022048 [Ensete ventricosum]RZS00379.1 hypothetical protein BHM03_00030070 [Ensete ventricosum]